MTEETQLRLLVIMRGIPGSGKSTYVKTYFQGGKVVSADKYMKQWGEFKPLRLKEAHDRCRVDCLMAMKRGTPLIVVDNTNIKAGEVLPYLKLAAENNYQVRIIQVECPTEVAAARNVHGVPLATVQKMADLLSRSPLGAEIVQGCPEGSEKHDAEDR